MSARACAACSWARSGRARRSPEDELERIAYHEAGHVVCAELCEHHENAQHVTIDPSHRTCRRPMLRAFRTSSGTPRMRDGVDRCDSRKMKQRGKSQEAPMVISPGDVARLLKQLFAGVRSGRNAKTRITEWRSRGGSR